MTEARKVAVILVADVVGYSRLAGADEERTLARLRGLRSDLIDPAIAAHHGPHNQAHRDCNIIEGDVRCCIGGKRQGRARIISARPLASSLGNYP